MIANLFEVTQSSWQLKQKSNNTVLSTVLISFIDKNIARKIVMNVVLFELFVCVCVSQGN